MRLEQIIKAIAQDTPDWESKSTPNRLASETPLEALPELSDFDGDFVAAYKIVISGLQPNSNGSGMNRATVIHGYSIKAIDNGRYKRQPKQFLCVQPKNSFGVTSRLYPEGDPHGEITCPKCYTFIKRHGLSQCRDPKIADLIDSY